MPWIQSQIKQKNGLLTHSPLSPLLSSSLSFSSSPPLPSYHNELTPPSSSGNKISPAVLFIIVIVAVIFFISSVLHLLVRILMKQRSSSPTSQSNRYPEMSSSDAFQRQLQQLFYLHDSGLDQAFIDALPVFLYKDLMGLKEPFDCAVCLCEFSEQDKLRLLPLCGHAFHIDCIDTWLLSNSTCPLCRGTLFSPGFSIENPVFHFDDSRDDGYSSSISISVPLGQKPAEDNDIGIEKRVFSVRLGKFKSANNGGGEIEVGETSNSNLDARRCYSMGSFQYVVADSELQVAMFPNKTKGNCGIDVRPMKGRGGQNGDSLMDRDDDDEGKKIKIGSKNESFSVSKIWQWSKKGKFPSSSDTHVVNSSVNVSLPWTNRTQST